MLYSQVLFVQLGSDGTRVGRRTRVGQAAAAPRRRRPCGGDTAAACGRRLPEAAAALTGGGDRRRRPPASSGRRLPLLLEMGRWERRGLNLACEKMLQSCSDEI